SPLSRRVLEQHHRLLARPRLERLSNGVADPPKALLVGAFRARAWMNDHAEKAERSGAIELVDEGVDRLLPQHRRGRCEVDQVAGVRDDRCDARTIGLAAKLANVNGIERFAAPLVGVLGEDLKCFASVEDGAVDGLRHTAGHRHVSTNTHDLWGPLQAEYTKSSRGPECDPSVSLLC